MPTVYTLNHIKGKKSEKIAYNSLHYVNKTPHFSFDFRST